mmetsp:Transcript_90836/g.256570  ORF Transcript_90836/g.256570 Transcript_90836/m.256570 type:complete len:217 (+) Transcript_90836:80-730(+)
MGNVPCIGCSKTPDGVIDWVEGAKPNVEACGLRGDLESLGVEMRKAKVALGEEPMEVEDHEGRQGEPARAILVPHIEELEHEAAQCQATQDDMLVAPAEEEVSRRPTEDMLVAPAEEEVPRRPTEEIVLSEDTMAPAADATAVDGFELMNAEAVVDYRHPHPLKFCTRANGYNIMKSSVYWTCDGCGAKSRSRSLKRYRCTQGCNFDLCEGCCRGA